MMADPQAVIAISATTVSASTIAFQVVQDGATTPIGVQTILLSGAIAVFLFFDRRERQALKERNDERRAADVRKDHLIESQAAKIEELQRELVKLLKERRG